MGGSRRDGKRRAGVLAACLALGFGAAVGAADAGGGDESPGEGFMASPPQWSRAMGLPTYCLTEATWRGSGYKRYGEEGITFPGIKVVLHERFVCRPLRHARTVELYVLGQALHTFAHERQHALFDVVDEARADCEGARTIPTVARAVGIPAGLARRAAWVRLRGFLPPDCLVERPAPRAVLARAAHGPVQVAAGGPPSRKLRP